MLFQPKGKNSEMIKMKVKIGLNEHDIVASSPLTQTAQIRAEQNQWLSESQTSKKSENCKERLFQMAHMRKRC